MYSPTLHPPETLRDGLVLMTVALCLYAPTGMTSAQGSRSEPVTKPAGDQAVLTRSDSVAIQNEPDDSQAGRYDWGPCVIRDRDLYRMWWVRLGGANVKRVAYTGQLPDGESFSFTYPDRGDRIYYAESRDGHTWHLGDADFKGSPHEFGPDAGGPMMVLAPSEARHEINHVGCPSVIRVENTWYMYYEAPSAYRLRRNERGQVEVQNEYHNQVFIATSTNGRSWHKHPSDDDPRPIIPAPASNHEPDRQRYGLGQPSVCYHEARFILHYVDSCTGPGDFVVRVESDDPFFGKPRYFPRRFPMRDAPRGTVARFAQIDVKYIDDHFYLVRPTYADGRLNLLHASHGLFRVDANVTTPAEVFPQVDVTDPRGPNCQERLFPRFLTDPHGRIILDDDTATIYLSTGLGFKEHAHTWDLRRCTVKLPNE